MTAEPTEDSKSSEDKESTEPAAPPASVALDPSRAAPPTEARGGFGWAEWLWQGQALAAARASAPAPLREARGLVEQADRLLDPIPALRHGSGAAAALELYTRALSLAGASQSSVDEAGDLEARARAARSRALTEIDARDPLPAEELRLYTRRWVRVGAVLGLVAALSAGVGFAFRSIARGPNLAAGRPWTTSSKYGGFSPEAHLVDNNKSSVFFHTNEEQDPWVQFDLGAPVNVARVVVKNRGDCCTERVLPLVITVSLDGTRWDEVARRNEPFSTWDAVFASKSARFVRLTTKKRTWMHLEAVSIHGK